MKRACWPMLLALCQCVHDSSNSQGGDPSADGTPGTATANGEVNGVLLTPQSAQYGLKKTSASAGSDNSAQAFIMLSSDPDACAGYAQDGLRVGSDALGLTVLAVASTTIGTGTFSVNDSANASTSSTNSGSATFYVVSTSGQLTQTNVDTGTITINASTSSLIGGTYSLNFGSDTVSGRFSAQHCAGLDSAF